LSGVEFSSLDKTLTTSFVKLGAGSLDIDELDLAGAVPADHVWKIDVGGEVRGDCWGVEKAVRDEVRAEVVKTSVVNG
jgi:hypothetical protein